MIIPSKYLRGRVLGLLVIVGIGIFLLYKVREVLVPFFWAAFLAYLLVRPVRYLEGRGWPRARAIFLLYLITGGTLVLVVALLLPAFLRELEALTTYIPRYFELYHTWWQKLQYHYHRSFLPEAVRQAVNQALMRTEARAVEGISGLIESLIYGYNSLVVIVLAPILSYYFLKDVEMIKRRFIAVLPSQSRADILSVVAEIDGVLLGFVRGNLLICLVIGIITAVVLSVLGVNFALLLGLIAGVAELIPYFGPFVGSLPAVVVALLESPRLALYTILALLVVQQLEGSVLAPRILGDRVGLHPLLVVFALFAGGKLWGIIGLLVAVPLAASIKVILNYIYMKCLED